MLQHQSRRSKKKNKSWDHGIIDNLSHAKYILDYLLYGYWFQVCLLEVNLQVVLTNFDS